MPQFWDWVDHTSFESNTTTVWRTDGDRSAWLSSRIGRPFAPGNYQSFRIEVDLTEVGAIVFDAMLMTSSGAAFYPFEASFWVYDLYGTGDPEEEQARLWWATEGGEYTDQVVDVSQFSGWHWIEIRLTALESGSFSTSYSALWDNLRVLAHEPEPEVIEAFIELDLSLFGLCHWGRWSMWHNYWTWRQDLHCLAPFRAKMPMLRTWHLFGGAKRLFWIDAGTLWNRFRAPWVTCYIGLEDSYDVMMIDGSTVTLEGIPAYMGRQRWATPEANNANILDLDSTGTLVRMVKFDRAAVGAIVQPPETEVTVTGLLTDGTPFEGSVAIRVINLGGRRR